MTIYLPYTYVLLHKPTGKRYYGSRYRKGCHPSDLFTTYFTSSKIVKKLIVEYGVESFIYEVRKTFTDSKQTRRWEAKVLRRLKVDNNDSWLNITSKECPTTLGKRYSDESRKKMSEAMKGKKKSPEHVANMRAARLGKKKSDEFREKCRKRHIGRKDSQETIAKRALSNTGKRRSPETIARIREAALKRHSRERELSAALSS